MDRETAARLLGITADAAASDIRATADVQVRAYNPLRYPAGSTERAQAAAHVEGLIAARDTLLTTAAGPIAAAPGPTPRPPSAPLGSPVSDWYPDPHNPSLMRFWDGLAWTHATRPATQFSPPIPASTVPERLKYTFRHTFWVRGRASHREFWTFCLFFVITTAAWIAALMVLGPMTNPSGGASPTIQTSLNVALNVSLVLMIGLIVPMATVTIRRLRDAGNPGVLIILAFFMVLGLVVLLFLLGQPSEQGHTKYGAPPAI